MKAWKKLEEIGIFIALFIARGMLSTSLLPAQDVQLRDFLGCSATEHKSSIYGILVYCIMFLAIACARVRFFRTISSSHSTQNIKKTLGFDSKQASNPVVCCSGVGYFGEGIATNRVAHMMPLLLFSCKHFGAFKVWQHHELAA